MLLDTRMMKAIEAKEEQQIRQGLSYTASDYARATSVFVFRMTWEGEEEGDLLSYEDTLEFVCSFEVDGDESNEEDVCKWLNEGRAFRIGPDEDWYRISPLEDPLAEDRWGDLVPLGELGDEFEPPFDCRAGVDYSASLAQ